jgi:chromosome segregation ATPase
MRQASDAATRQADHESERVLRIQTDVKAANERLEAKNQTLAEMQARSAILQQQALEQQGQSQETLRNAHAKLDAAQVRLTGLEKQLAVATETLQYSRSEMAEGHRRHSGLESTLARVNGSLAQRSNELQMAQAFIARLSDEKDLAFTDAHAEKERARIKEKEVNSAERLVDELRLEATKVQERFRALQLAVTAAEAQVKKSDITLVEAKRKWDALERQYQLQVETLQQHLMEAVKAGQSMYVAVCQPSAGVASGLGLMLTARPGHASGAVVAELVAGSVAMGCSSQMAVGDLIVEVGGVSAVGLSLEEVESIMCGPLGEAVQIRAQTAGNGAVYEIVLARGCGHDKSAVSDLVGHMQADTWSTAARMRKEMEALREARASEFARNDQDSQMWCKDKEQLTSELAQARNNEMLAQQQRTDARALMRQHAEDSEKRKQGFSMNLEKVNSLVRIFIADMYGRLSEIEIDRQRVMESNDLLGQKLAHLANTYTKLAKDHSEALERWETWELEKKTLVRQNKILATDLDRSQVKIADHEAESRDLAAKLLRAGRERDTLQNNLTAVMPQLTDAQAAVAKLESLVETREREAAELAARTRCLHTQVQELSFQLRSAMSTNRYYLSAAFLMTPTNARTRARAHAWVAFDQQCAGDPGQGSAS